MKSKKCCNKISNNNKIYCIWPIIYDIFLHFSLNKNIMKCWQGKQLAGMVQIIKDYGHLIQLSNSRCLHIQLLCSLRRHKKATISQVYNLTLMTIKFFRHKKKAMNVIMCERSKYLQMELVLNCRNQIFLCVWFQ